MPERTNDIEKVWEKLHDHEKIITVIQVKMETLESHQTDCLLTNNNRHDKLEERFDKTFLAFTQALQSIDTKLETFIARSDANNKTHDTWIKQVVPIVLAVFAAGVAVYIAKYK